MSSFNIEEIGSSILFDSNEIKNSTIDVSKESILFINNESSENLNKFVKEALDKNARTIVTSEVCSVSNDKIIKVEDYTNTFNKLLKKLCPNYEEKNYYGITGTNGKTTTGFYLNQLITSDSLFIGTNESKLFEKITKEEHLTTPKLFNILKLLGLKDNKDINDVVIEVSSHALDQERLKGLKFKVSGFTNLSQDHFDYHKNIENYFNAKLKLFSEGFSEKLVYIDSEWGNKINSLSKIPSFSIGFTKKNNLYIKKINITKENYELNFEIEGKKYDITVPLSGPESHLNYLLALSMAYSSEVNDIDSLLELSNTLKNPKGRYEIISYKNSNDIIIDYAHTPESIYQVISFARNKYKKIIVIFGAGGNRDKIKRSLMGKSARFADKVIITNDNPRDENEEEIVKDILRGIELNKDVTVILDRKQAIKEGINNLDKDSVLLILGKGHEKIQEFKNSKIDFSDQEVVSNFIKETL